MKLDNEKIKQICKRFDTNKVSIKLLSRQFKVTTKRIKQILIQYQELGTYPKLKKVGRPTIIMDIATKQLIKDVYLKYKKNAIMLSYYLERDFKIKISKNKVHLVLKEFGLAKSDPKKAKPRKKVRYERKHTHSLWHVDWHYLDNGDYLIAFIDDASRKVFSLEYPFMTAENSIDALKKAFNFFGAKPKELMSDNGTQFKQLKFNKKKDCNHQFMLYCKDTCIKQLFTRASRPQTNGKIERWFGTYELKRKLFETHIEFQEWYNNSLHSNLSWKYAKFESPNEAFTRKMKAENIFAKYQQKVFN